MATTRKDLSELLREARLEKDLSQRDLAKLLGVSQGAISSWESNREENRSRPAVSRIAKIAEILEIDIADLTLAAAG